MRDTRGTFYPIVLRLRDRRVLVVGGGKVAARRAGGLAEAGARVVAVSPEFAPAFRRLGETHAVRRIKRPYESGDVAGAGLVVAATDDHEVNARVRADARRAGILVSVADDSEHSDFLVSAVARRGDLVLAISTGGGQSSPRRRLAPRAGRAHPCRLGDPRAVARPGAPPRAARGRGSRAASGPDEAAGEAGPTVDVPEGRPRCRTQPGRGTDYSRGVSTSASRTAVTPRANACSFSTGSAPATGSGISSGTHERQPS